MHGEAMRWALAQLFSEIHLRKQSLRFFAPAFSVGTRAKGPCNVATVLIAGQLAHIATQYAVFAPQILILLRNIAIAKQLPERSECCSY